MGRPEPQPCRTPAKCSPIPADEHAPLFTALVIFAVVVVLLGIAVVAVLMSGSDRLYPPDDREEDDED
jgi:hypothetical protein